MKRALTYLSACLFAVSAQASDVKLVVQKVDNGGIVPGNTYRVYAQMPDASHSLHIVYGDQANPLHIESTAPFYQHENVGASASGLLASEAELHPAMKYDSWITLGYQDSEDNDMWHLGVDFSTFDNNGGSLDA